MLEKTDLWETKIEGEKHPCAQQGDGKVGRTTKQAVEHFKEALDFKRRTVGASTFPASDVLEVLGKYYIELGELRPAYDCL